MTQDNIFKEIEEDLERQKLEDWWKKYGAAIIAAALGIVLATAIYNFWQGHEAGQRQKTTGELATILTQTKDETQQSNALLSFAQNNPGQTQSTLAELHAASLAAKQDKKQDAIRIYDAVAADTKAEHAFRQLADLLSVEIQLESGDPAQLQKRLQPLIENKEPWRFTAMEYSGYLALRAGDKEKAKEIFTNLAQDASAPQSLTTRAAEMLRLLAE